MSEYIPIKLLSSHLEIFIKGIMHMNPQNITYEILKYAREHQKITEDDMCVITLKIKDAN